MIIYIAGSLLLLTALLALALQRLYSCIPARELKRLAARKDYLAQQLYRVVAYGPALRVLLWCVLGATLPLGFLLLIPVLPPLAGFALLLIVSLLAFVWLPSLPLTVHSAQFAAWFTTPLAWVLSRAHPYLERIAGTMSRWRDLTLHSRLYEKEDLQELLELQKEQADNRIDEKDLDLASRVLLFGDRHAADIMQPLKEGHLVNANDAIGPVLLDQLHQSGQNLFLAYKDEKENIIGALSMSDAITAKHGGRVFDLVHNNLAYVHEDFTLHDVLIAFRKTGQRALLVINKFEDFLGLITFDRLMDELLGEYHDELDVVYENRTAVATFEKPKKRQTEAEQTAQPENAEQTPASASSPQETEVVE